MSKEVLVDTLRIFYASARQKPKDTDPPDTPLTCYAKQSLINIRSGINRHLSLPPYNKTWDLM